MATKELKKKEFTLPNKKVTIVPIMRARGPIKDEKHEAFFLFGNATIDVCVPMDRMGNLIDPLSPEEREYFEDKSRSGMPFNVGELSIYNKPAENYWTTFRIKLSKDERVLNLSNPKDYLEYKVLLSNKELVAPSGDVQYDKMTYKFALISEDFAQKTNLNEADQNERAWTKFGEIRNNRAYMSNFLKIYGRMPSEDSNDDFLRNEITKIIKEDIKSFLSITEDDMFEDKILIHRAVRAGAIKISKGNYILPGGDKMCEPGDKADIVNAIKFLKDPENQEVYATVRERIEIAEGKTK